MKVELMVPEEFANLIAEKVVEKIMPLLEAKPLQPSTTQHYQKDIDPMRAMSEREVSASKCDLIAVGRPFLANPDLVARWRTGATLNVPDMATFYTPGPKGYTDYPALKQ